MFTCRRDRGWLVHVMVSAVLAGVAGCGSSERPAKPTMAGAAEVETASKADVAGAMPQGAGTGAEDASVAALAAADAGAGAADKEEPSAGDQRAAPVDDDPTAIDDNELVGWAEVWIELADAWDLQRDATPPPSDDDQRESARTVVEEAERLAGQVRATGATGRADALLKLAAGLRRVVEAGGARAGMERQARRVLEGMRKELDVLAGMPARARTALAPAASARACIVSRIDVARAIVAVRGKLDEVEHASYQRTHGTSRAWDDPRQLMAEKDHAELGMEIDMWREWLDDADLFELATPSAKPPTAPPQPPGSMPELERTLPVLTEAIRRALAACK